jgi:hypothetical protein
MSKEGESLEFSYQPAPEDVLTVEGVKFSGQFFRDFLRDVPLDTPFKIVERRADGVVCVEKLEPLVQVEEPGG